MIAFTYDLSTAVGQVRLFSGDNDPEGLNRSGGDRTRTDEEIAALLAQSGNCVRLAAAQLLEIKAAQYASQAMEIAQGSLRQDFRMRSRRLMEAAAALRASADAPPLWNPPSQSAPFTAGDGGTMEGW
jgi:hypothetical protein